MRTEIRVISACLSGTLCVVAAACARDDGSPPLVDDDDQTTGAPATGTSTGVLPTTEADDSSSGFQPVCIPGEIRCAGDAALETCDDTGLGWTTTECGTNRTCEVCDAGDESCVGARCVGLCESDQLLPSSAGCSFIVNRMLHLNDEVPDGVVIANPNDELIAHVQLYKIPEGDSEEVPEGDEIVLQPGQSHTYEINTSFVIGTSTQFRSGGMFRIDSDIPIIAYHHAPLTLDRGNDSSLLLPENLLRNDYIVFSYAPHAPSSSGQGRPSYFEVIALENNTTVRWWPTADTAGNSVPVEPVVRGEMGEQGMNRYDTMRVVAAECPVGDPDAPCPPYNDPVVNEQDLSGTVISADKPIWVVGASRCSRVPVRLEPLVGRCDPLQELLIPINYWGNLYVAAASPRRTDERHHWRIYSGGENVTVRTTPEQPGTPHTFAARGEWIELSVASGENFIIESEGGVVMPVQYLQSRWASGEPMTERTLLGDPAMTQTVPVEQFLDRYVFATAVNYDLNYVQVIRRMGGADVIRDGSLVGGWTQIGDFEVANVPINQGEHLIESADPFGIMQFGYSTGIPNMKTCPDPGNNYECYTSYAYPGGMKVEEIVIP